MKVCKFGGVAMATADSVRRVSEILDSDATRRIVVVSAMGRRFKEDNKVTDILYDLVCRDKLKERLRLLEEVFDRYYNLYNTLKVDFDLSPFYREYAVKLSGSFEKDDIISLGERLSGTLFSIYLGWEYIDSKKCILFNDDQVDFQKSFKLVNKVLEGVEKAVFPGFYGADVTGQIKLLSRGGSDVSGAIIARGVNAALYENWTDVNGYYCVDPNIIDNPKHIEYLSYDELFKLSIAGAGTLHYDSVIPLRNKIPILIKSVFEPSENGTIISEKCGKPKYIAVKRNLGRLTIEKDIKDFYRLKAIVEKTSGNIERFTTSTGKLRLYLQGVDDTLIELLAKLEIPYTVTHYSLITIGGVENMFDIMKTLEKLSIYDVTLEDSEIVFAVNDDELEEIVRNIYKVL